MSVLGRFCCKSLFALAIKISFGCTGDFHVNMWGTSLSEEKLAGDLGNVIEATSIGGRRSDFFTAGKLAPDNFGLLQHGVIPGPCHTKARGISSPGIDEGPPHGALQSWRAAMEHYVGLDVSLKLTAICIVDQTGRIEREGVVASNPEAIAAFIKSHAPHVARIGLETGATSTWLWTELNKLGLPIICIDARHAKAALRMQINKSDRNDAVGIARIMQCGWYKEVRVKDLDSHAIKALLVSRALLVKIKRDLENQIRGLLKNLGLVIGPAKMNVFALRAAELTKDRPELTAAVTPLLTARVAIEQQVADLDRKVMKLVRNNAQVQHFMTAPGIGPVTAL